MSELFIQELDCETGEETRRVLTPAEVIEFQLVSTETLAFQTDIDIQEANAKTIREQLTIGLVTVETHLTNLAAPAPTAAQQKAALIFSLKATKQLVRLALRALDQAN